MHLSFALRIQIRRRTFYPFRSSQQLQTLLIFPFLPTAVPVSELRDPAEGRFFTPGETPRVSSRDDLLSEEWLLGGKSHCRRIWSPSLVSAYDIGDAANKGD